MPTNNPTILLIYCGGTLGMQPSQEGLTPVADFAGRLTEQLSPAAQQALGSYQLQSLTPAIDSANAGPDDWRRIAQVIIRHYDDYAGFVVLHGTDTLAYSASALSFMLGGLGKPVIFTGAQVPLLQPPSDALNNLLQAAHFARQPALQEVCICFAGLLLRGNRSRKVSSRRWQAFTSDNFPPLAVADQPDRILAEGPFAGQFLLPEVSRTQVALLPLYPGIQPAIIDAALANRAIQGVILQSFGAGNPPAGNTHLMQRLHQAHAAGVSVVNISHCPHGQVVPGAYASAAELARAGVIPGSDLTLEAAYTKLLFLLASEPDPDRVRRAMARALRGEMSPYPTP